MYTCVRLNLYCEDYNPIATDIKNIITNTGTPFKEIRNSTLLFSAIKNPNNIVIVAVTSRNLLAQLEEFSKCCHNYQNRLFIILKDSSLNDHFFNNHTSFANLAKLSTFLKHVNSSGLSNPLQTSNLLVKLVQYELQKLQIPTKYRGFTYLTQLAVNYLCNNYPINTYIELFEHVANINLASIDTIERDVRHMLLTTWKNNVNFCNKLQLKTPIEKPNSKNILSAILSYLKSTI